MNKKIRWITALFLIIVCCIMTFIGTYYYMSRKTWKLSQTENLFSKLTTVNDLVNKYYIGSVNTQNLVEKMLKGYIEGLGDPYAQYFTNEEYRLYTKNISGEYEGIGITTTPSADGKALYVHFVHKDSPAGKSGVKIGDLIVAVGSENVADIGYEASVQKLKGKVGTMARFAALRGDKEIEFEVKRESFVKTTVEGKIVGDIAYVRIYEFDKNTPEAFDTVLEGLLEKDPLYFVFDVRYNPGGDLTAVSQVLERLLPPCIIMTAEEKPRKDAAAGDESHIKHYKTSDDIELDYPMAVLINEESASGAEVFAAALKVYKQASLVGKTSFGKGVGQTIIDLPDGSALKITTFNYLPPNGESYNGIGIKPDVEVGMPASLFRDFYALAPANDPQLVAAARELGGSLEITDGENGQENNASSSGAGSSALDTSSSVSSGTSSKSK